MTTEPGRGQWPRALGMGLLGSLVAAVLYGGAMVIVAKLAIHLPRYGQPWTLLVVLVAMLAIAWGIPFSLGRRVSPGWLVGLAQGLGCALLTYGSLAVFRALGRAPEVSTPEIYSPLGILQGAGLMATLAALAGHLGGVVARRRRASLNGVLPRAPL